MRKRLSGPEWRNDGESVSRCGKNRKPVHDFAFSRLTRAHRLDIMNIRISGRWRGHGDVYKRQAYEECVLGTGASTGERAALMPGVKLWPGKFAADGERLEENVVWGSRRPDGFAAGSFALSSPAQATRAAQAVASVMKPKELLLGRGPSAVSDALWHALASGAMSQGVQVLDAGVCTLPQLRHALAALRADAAALVSDDRLLPLRCV